METVAWLEDFTEGTVDCGESSTAELADFNRLEANLIDDATERAGLIKCPEELTWLEGCVAGRETMECVAIESIDRGVELDSLPNTIEGLEATEGEDKPTWLEDFAAKTDTIVECTTAEP